MADKPANTHSPGAVHYYSGVAIQRLVLPNIREDPTWVSQWKFDNMGSLSGLDSQNQNHLKPSGGWSEVAGFRQTSGVQFNGVDSAFYLEWYEGSGIGDLIRTGQDVYPGNPDGVPRETTQDPHYGFMCSMYIDDFSQDQIILSKWNEIGSDQEYMVGITTSGTVWWQNRRTNGWLAVMETQTTGMIPSGEWFDFMFHLHGVNSTSTSSGPGWVVGVNDQLNFNIHGGNATPEEVGASGIFCIGAADVNGVQPSGFFTGRMEDFRWFNGKGPSIAEWNAFTSGVTPLAAYPSFNDLNPYIGQHWQMNLGSGGPEEGDPIDPTGEYFTHDRKSGYRVWGSGSQWKETSIRREDGPFDGEFGSGIGSIGPTVNTGQHIMTRNNNFIDADTQFAPKGSFSIMYWVKPYIAVASAQTFFGWRTVTIPNGPFTLQLAGMQPTLYIGYDHGQRPSFAAHAIPSGHWTHVAHVVDYEEGLVHTYTSGVWYKTDDLSTSGLWPAKLAANQPFRYIQQSTNTTSYGLSGILDEVILINYPMTSGQIVDAYQSQSGFIIPAQEPSGIEGGYVGGQDIDRGSGVLGGYVIVGPSASGAVGGYVSGVPFYESGVQGGYIVVGPPASGLEGGYIKGILGATNTVGGWVRSSGVAGAFEAGYIRGVEPTDQANNFVAFYNIIGRDKDEFDAQVQVAKSLGYDFDAMAVVYRDEKKPGTLMVNPPIAYSGHTGSPVTINFEARASGLQGKDIFRTFWFFSDDTSTSGSTVSSSGTYTTEHTFAESGIFDVLFVAIDEKGLINSSRTLVNTASGATLPEIRLTASPESGIVPLQVGFSGIIDSAPTEIRDEYIYFGDGTRSPSTRSIYKMYPVIGCYIPCYRVRDAEGFIVTDSTVIGANN
jgi:hypothetical protein